MAFGRAVTLGENGGWGESVWLLLCRSACAATRWSARVFASIDTEEPLERAELLVQLGGVGGAAPPVPLAVDWAKLGDAERALLARELGRFG